MAGEPTLHYGDQSADGWVEYLQQLLNVADTGLLLVSDGIFGPKTIEAVYGFQAVNNLQVDGVVGNQTWARLRGEDPAEIGTDGHAHQETDATMHAVFFTESSAHGRNGEYFESTDSMMFVVQVVGAKPIPDDHYNIWVNFHSDAQLLHNAMVKLRTLGGRDEAAAGELLIAEVEGIKALLGGSGHYTYDAAIPPGLGDETHQGEFTVE